MERIFVARDTKKQPIAYINMIPLIDVMLVILIVFILLAGTVYYQQLTVKLPQDHLQGQFQPQKSLVIYINKRGKYFQLTPNKHLTPLSLQQLTKTSKVFLMAGPKTSYQQVVKLLGLLQQQHINNVNLVTQTTNINP